MRKQILILISVAIFAALVTTGTCSGPIDQVFTGWRDTTGCTVGGGWNCFGRDSLSNDYLRDAGAFTLIILSILSVPFYGLLKLTQWIWNKLGDE